MWTKKHHVHLIERKQWKREQAAPIHRLKCYHEQKKKNGNANEHENAEAKRWTIEVKRKDAKAQQECQSEKR